MDAQGADGADAADAGDRLRSDRRQRREVAVGVEQFGGDGARGLAAGAGAQEQREQVGVAEAFGAMEEVIFAEHEGLGFADPCRARATRFGRFFAISNGVTPVVCCPRRRSG